MNLVRKVISVLGGVFLAALLIAALAPKATRAVAAILVTVTNTSANPVITAPIPQSAAQNVELFCYSRSVTVFGFACGQVTAQFGAPLPGAQYTVPAGQSLVVTTIDVAPQTSSPGTIIATLATLDPQSLNYFNREAFTVPNGLTTQFQFPVAGIVIPSGLQPLISNEPNAFVTIRGYLTPD